MEILNNCEHKFEGHSGVLCTNQAGHEGCHYALEKTSLNGFTIHEWNDRSEIPAQFFDGGMAFQVNHNDGHAARQETMNLAIFDAHKSLKKGIVFEIRAKLLPSSTIQDYGRIKRSEDEMAADWGVCWYYVPKQNHPSGFQNLPDLSTDTEPLFVTGVDSGIEIRTGGYLLLARIKAGDF